MKQHKFYYIIEEIDINGDKQSDGFLISQYKLDKQNNKIFTKNKYVTYEKFRSVMNKYKKVNMMMIFILAKTINHNLTKIWKIESLKIYIKTY